MSGNPHILSPSAFFDLIKSLKLSDRARLTTHDAQLRTELQQALVAAEAAPSEALPSATDDVETRAKIVAYLRRLGGEGKTVRAAQIIRVADLIETGAYLETP